MWDQGLEGTDSGAESSRGSIGSLTTGTNRAGQNKIPSISGHRLPPESLIHQKQGTPHPWVTSHLGAMAPPDNIGP